MAYALTLPPQLLEDGVQSSECLHCGIEHPLCPRCCLPESVDRIGMTRDFRPTDTTAILNRWHYLGHPEVPLSRYRKVAQLPFWLLMITPAGFTDVTVVREGLGLES